MFLNLRFLDFQFGRRVSQCLDDVRIVFDFGLSHPRVFLVVCWAKNILGFTLTKYSTNHFVFGALLIFAFEAFRGDEVVGGFAAFFVHLTTFARFLNISSFVLIWITVAAFVEFTSGVERTSSSLVRTQLASLVGGVNNPTLWNSLASR